MSCKKTQSGWGMILPGSLLSLMLLFSVAFNAFSYVLEDDPLGQFCLNKSAYAKALVLGRSDPGEHQKEMQFYLDKIEEQWRENDNYPTYAYVDMQRLVRKAYRINGDQYRHVNPEIFADNEFVSCLGQGF